MQKITALLFLTFFYVCSYSQTGRISGTIADAKTGETLPGATILVEGTTKGAQADFDGKFSINNVPAGEVNLVVSYISYASKKITNVKVIANDVTFIEAKMEASGSQELGEVTVEVVMARDNVAAQALIQKNNTSLSDGISQEAIRTTPDRTTSDVLKRISAVTIVDDKFVIIRGLNERYNASYLNGSPLPSTEPDKRAFAFDLFPSNMLDNIIINKTATPDMPSEFAGGIVQVNTKSIPEKNFVSIMVGSGYNMITTFKDRTIYDGGKYDKLGFDDGSRDLPSGVPAYAEKASWISNNDQARVGTYFKNDWGYSQGKFSPNHNLQFATGYNIKRNEKDFLGVIFSLTNNNTYNLYNRSRTEYDVLSITGNNDHTPQPEQQYSNVVNQLQANTGALLNLSCKINENNSISVKNMLNGSSDDKFIASVGTNTIGAPGLTNRVNARYFTANQIFNTQINGDHFFAAPKIKIAWNVGVGKIKRTVPNMRFTSYTKNDNFTDPSDPHPNDTIYRADIGAGATSGPNYSGYRVYSNLDESINSAKLDVSRLMKINENNKIDVKVGGFYQIRQRQYNIRQFGTGFYTRSGIQPDYDLINQPEDQIFAASNMSVAPSGMGGFKVFEITSPTDNYFGQSKLSAGYIMGEYKYAEKLRLIGGFRYESYFQQLNILYNKIDSIFVKSTVNDLLPSLNAVYNLTEKTALRGAYYKTLNRAEFRELTLTNWFDPETRLSTAGNPELQRCYIQNYDLRLETYPGRGQLFTITGFYKYFNSPIERYMLGGSENQIYYRNANSAVVKGAELEYRLNLGSFLKKDSVRILRNLNLMTNLALIQSDVDVKGINDKVPDHRTMQGQAPYLINAGIMYNDKEKGVSFSAMFNRVGERIYIVGNDQIANRWENARSVLDLQVGKTFLKNKLEVRLNAKDIFHQDAIIYYKGTNRPNNSYRKDEDYVNFKRNFGTTYSFVITYKF
jgi:TonB-dependent receptor